MKKVWIVKHFEGYKKGMQEIARFDNPGKADRWLMNHIKTVDYHPYDYTIVCKESK